jgi:hypothetical protein
MTLNLESWKEDLITKILFATTQAEVKEYVDVTVQKLQRRDLEGLTLSGFTDTMLEQLDVFSPMDETAQQWSNISVAKILFNRLKRDLEAPVNR